MKMWRQGECPMEKGSPGGWGTQTGGGSQGSGLPSKCEGPHPRPHFPPRRPRPDALPLPSVTRHPRPHPFLRLSHSRRLPGLAASCSVPVSEGAGRSRAPLRSPSVRPGSVRLSLGGGRCRDVHLSFVGCTPVSLCSGGIPPPGGVSVCRDVRLSVQLSGCMSGHLWLLRCLSVFLVSIYWVVCLSMGVSPYL